MDIDEFLDREVQAKSSGQKGEKQESHEHSHKVMEEVRGTYGKDDYLHSISVALEKENFEAAEKLYIGLWEHMKGASWDSSLYEDIFAVGQRIRQSLSKFHEKIGRRISYADGEVAKAAAALQKGDHKTALSHYSEANDIYNELPVFMHAERRELQRKVFGLYSEIKEKIDEKLVNIFEESLRRIYSLISDSMRALEGNDFQSAKKSYEECLLEFRSLPLGFLDERVQAASRIMDLYRQVAIKIRIRELEGQLLSGKGTEAPGMQGMQKRDAESRSEMLRNLLVQKRISSARKRMDSGDYGGAKPDLESALKLDPHNPDGLNLMKELMQGG